MLSCFRIVLAGFWLMLVASQVPAQSVNLTGVTLYGATESGNVRIAERWNTLYSDPAWDVGLYEGQADDGLPVNWLNDPDDLSVNVPLAPGETRTFTAVVAAPDTAAPMTFYGVNLFFDGTEQIPPTGTPDISVFAITDDDAPGDPPSFQANSSLNTMGWPISDTAGSGALTFENCGADVRVTMTDFVVYSTAALGLDLVQRQEPGNLKAIDGNDTLPDLIAQFTLEVVDGDPATCIDPLTGLVCDRPTASVVNLSWTNNGPYDAIKILRDGGEIAEIDGAEVAFIDDSAPTGTQEYEVVAVKGGAQLGLACTTFDPSRLRMTAATFYGTDATGAVRIEERWNTLYLDLAWDVVLFEDGVVLDQGDVDSNNFLNEPDDLSIDIPMVPGEHTFGFSVATPFTGPNFYGLNLFFNNQQLEPGNGFTPVSVFAFTDEDGPDVGVQPPFQANSAGNTMGWPIADTAGSGSLLYVNCDAQMTVELVEFQVYTPNAIGVDMVPVQEPGALNIKTAPSDGLPDVQGQFTLQVTDLGGECLDPPRQLICARDPVLGTIGLTWVNQQVYDRILVFRDTVQIADLDGTAMEYTDTDALPPGDVTYEVRGVIGAQEDGPAACSVSVLEGVVMTALTWNRASIVDGGVVPSERWNTNYIDSAWDIGIAEFDLLTAEDEFDPGGLENFWVNDPQDLSIQIPLDVCEERTFTIGVGRAEANPDDNFFYNVNVFFNGFQLAPVGSTGTPNISVIARTSTVGPESGGPFPNFAANASASTMGWPINDAAGSGTLVYEDVLSNIRVEMTDFVVYQQSAFGGGGGIDFGSVQEPGGVRYTAGPDGAPDLLAEFTLTTTPLDGGPCPGDGPLFRRGDHDGSGLADITDGLNLLGFLFLGTTPPICGNASDFDNSGLLDITDALILLGHLFLGQPNALPAPGTSCGLNPDTPQPEIPPIPMQDVSDLGCDKYPGDNFPGAACP